MKRSIALELRGLVNLIRRRNHTFGAVRKADTMTGTHGYVLFYLYGKTGDGEDVFQRDIESEFEMRRSTATEMLNIMERNGLIERRPVERDKRLKKIVLTPAAIALSDEIRGDCTELERLMAQGIDEDELNAFFRVVDQIKSNIVGAFEAGGKER